MESYEADITAKFNKGEFNAGDLDKAWAHYYGFTADLRKIFYK
jgi:hypothetical protein